MFGSPEFNKDEQGQERKFMTVDAGLGCGPDNVLGSDTSMCNAIGL